MLGSISYFNKAFYSRNLSTLPLRQLKESQNNPAKQKTKNLQFARQS